MTEQKQQDYQPYDAAKEYCRLQEERFRLIRTGGLLFILLIGLFAIVKVI